MFDNYYTKYEQAETFISSANADEIADELEKEIKAKTMTAEKYAYLSKAYVFKQDTKKAIKYAKESIKKDKKYPYGYIRLAFAYAKDGNKKQTLKNAQIAEKLCNDNYLFNTFLVIFYDFCAETEHAEDLFKSIERNNDNTAPYLYNLGFLYDVVKKDSITAEEYYKEAEAADYKDKFNLYSNLAEIYSNWEDIDNTKYYVNKCHEIKETEDILEKLVDCYIYEGDFEEAKNAISKYFRLSKNRIYAHLKLATVYDRLGEMDKALRCYNFALKFTDNTQKEYIYNIIAGFFENHDEYESAIEYYQKAFNLNKKNSSALAGISYCYSQLREHEEALNYIELALKLNKDSSYNHYRKARVLTDMKNYEGAINSYIDALDYDKSDLDCYQWISYCYSMLKNYEKSLEYANRAIILNKEDCYSYFRKAWAYQELKKYPEAIEFYKECIKRNDKYIDAYVNISYIYSKMRDLKQSMIWANKAILIDKDYAYAHYRKAWVNQENGNFDEAIENYSKAIELDPTDIYNYLGIACISLNTQANVNALLYANKAILIDRNCGGAYYYKSLALSNLGKIKEAEKAFSTALQLGYSPS